MEHDPGQPPHAELERDPGHAPHEVLRALAALVVLRSRRAAHLAASATPRDGRRAPRSARLLARTTLRRESPELRAAFLGRESRLAADDQILADYEAASAAARAAHPAVLSIRPPADSPAVSRLATDGVLLKAALEAGRATALVALA